MVYVQFRRINNRERKIMPDISKFKSVSVSIKTDNTLEKLSKTLFPVEVSKQKVIEYLINEHLNKVDIVNE